MAWETIKVIESSDRQRRLLLLTDAETKRFTYAAERYFAPCSEDEGGWPNGFWQSDDFENGGYFQTLELAEREAHLVIGWLKYSN